MQENIYFHPTEIPLGALVRFCIPGSDEPVDDVPTLTCLLGGVPDSPRLYDLTGDNPTIFGECNKFVDGVRFVPVAIYTAETAPKNMELIVHSGGNWLNYAAYPHCRMLVTKLADGSFMSVCGHAHDHWLRRVDLPKDGRLVSTGKCKRAQTIDDATMMFIEPRSEEWAMLEKAGCVFHRVHSGDFAGKNPYHVWMPDGWHLEQTEHGLTNNDVREYAIKDANGDVRAHATFFPQKGKQCGGVSIRK